MYSGFLTRVGRKNFMSGNSFNLIDLVRGHLTDTFTNRLASALGENKDQTHSALSGAVPRLLSALDNSASTSDGARRLTSAIEGFDDSVLDNTAGLFGKGVSPDTNLETLRSAMGSGGFSDLTGALGRSSGFSGRNVSSIIAYLAPIVLGVIKRAMRSRGLKFSDIANFLAGQRANISTAMATEMPPRETLREVNEETYTGPRATSRIRTSETYTEAAAEPRGGGASWILPLALLAGVLGMIWYLASRPTTHAGFEDKTTTGRVTGLHDEFKYEGWISPELKSKYQSVFREARDQGVHFSSIRQHDGKLVLKGAAPSLEAANRVWNEIKRVNPSLNDISADISTPSSVMPLWGGPEPGSEAIRMKPGTTDSQTYTVQAGDTLSSISRHFYGNADDYTRILEANRSQIHDKDVIEIGQELLIPTE
jgi:hypothetical protein